MTDLESIPFDSIQFSPDTEFTKNQAYHAAAILIFHHPELPDKFQQLKDLLHAGLLQTPHELLGYEESIRPPSVGESAYNEDGAWPLPNFLLTA